MPETCATALRKQSRHRQSPPSDGIGSRAFSSAHQHCPDRLQVNSAPQPEQARRREGGGVSRRLVMQRTALLRSLNSGFFANAPFFATNYKLEAAKRTPKPSIRPKRSNRQLKGMQWPAIRRLLWSRSIVSLSFQGASKMRTRNPGLPRCAIAHLRWFGRPGMTN